MKDPVPTENLALGPTPPPAFTVDGPLDGLYQQMKDQQVSPHENESNDHKINLPELTENSLFRSRNPSSEDEITGDTESENNYFHPDDAKKDIYPRSSRIEMLCHCD